MVATADFVGVGLASVAIPAFVLVAIAIQHRAKPGAHGFAVSVFGIGCWSVATGLRVLVNQPAHRYAATVGMLVFTNVTVLGWLLLVAEFLRRRRVRPSPLAVAGILAVPVLTVAFALTNDWHHLLYGPGTHVTDEGFLAFEFGPWYPIHTVYILSLNVLPAAALAWDFIGSTGIHRRQVALLFTAWGVAFVGSFDFFLRNFGPWPFPAYVDITPVGFLLASGVWGLALFRHDLFELVPIGRRTAVETMPDAVLTVDGDGAVVDANPAAETLFDGDVLRRSVRDVFADHPTVLDHYYERKDGSTEVQFLRDGEVKHFATTTTPVAKRGTQTGTVIVLRDVTTLKNREQELDLHRQVHNRIVRHNLRNELTIIRGNAEEIVRAGEGEVVEFATTILDRSDELVGTNEKARHIMRIIENDGELLTLETVSLVETIAAETGRQYPNARIETALPDEAWVTAHEDLEVAVRNLVENAIVHNEGTARVDVTIERTGDTVEIAIADDGPGIPDHEISVLDQLEETALEHSNGAGLWLVNWVVMKSDGELDFTVTDQGTTVTLRLPAAQVTES